MSTYKILGFPDFDFPGFWASQFLNFMDFEFTKLWVSLFLSFSDFELTRFWIPWIMRFSVFPSSQGKVVVSSSYPLCHWYKKTTFCHSVSGVKKPLCRRNIKIRFCPERREREIWLVFLQQSALSAWGRRLPATTGHTHCSWVVGNWRCNGLQFRLIPNYNTHSYSWSAKFSLVHLYFLGAATICHAQTGYGKWEVYVLQSSLFGHIHDIQ